MCPSFGSSAQQIITKEAKTLTSRASAKQMRRECHKDIHRFARRVLDDEGFTTIKPSFTKEQAEEFSPVYTPHHPRPLNDLHGCPSVLHQPSR